MTNFYMEINEKQKEPKNEIERENPYKNEIERKKLFKKVQEAQALVIIFGFILAAFVVICVFSIVKSYEFELGFFSLPILALTVLAAMIGWLRWIMRYSGAIELILEEAKANDWRQRAEELAKKYF